MRAFTAKRWIRFLFIGLVFSGQCILAQSSDDDPFTKADASLNKTYKQALARFAPPNQEVLRKAERAWIDFSNKQEAVLNALHNENLLSQEAVDKATIDEVNARTIHLTVFFVGNTLPPAPPGILQNMDQQLQKAYDDCLQRLSVNNQKLLREAERSWITYRDADSVSVMAAHGNQSVQIAGIAHLIALRSVQLAAIVKSLGQPASTVQASTPTPTPSIKEDQSKEYADLKANAQKMLSEFIAQKNSGFFAPADDINKAPELPADVDEAVSACAKKFAVFTLRLGETSSLLQSGENEIKAVFLLGLWSDFVKSLKSGSVEAADFTFERMRAVAEKDAPAEYAPIWKAVDDWRKVYKKVGPDFLDHYRKARSLAKDGKTGAATREYQAAYKIIQNPDIPEQIKKLHEQSLGL